MVFLYYTSCLCLLGLYEVKVSGISLSILLKMVNSKRLEVLRAKMMMLIVEQCKFLDGYQHFGCIYCHSLQG
jgi:hypothetical protein